jgi:ABC-type antimicrobial peptide transport system permease subunit
VAPRRFGALTLTGFAVGSLLLAAVGLYGLLAFTVGERRREIAVRLALGAEPPTILRMVVGSGMKLVLIGLTIGVALSYGLGRYVATQLYRTDTHDLPTYGVVPLVLLVAALVACVLPAYRAARVEPITALRAE